ncbi:MAG: hypothetical protein HC881_12275 [Leptolyngbyaceae cyanobacterium SL_7_1]|nr:hypothetical protein [Leptolyngbyaceae cyanobacterium SL_7_1]
MLSWRSLTPLFHFINPSIERLKGVGAAIDLTQITLVRISHRCGFGVLMAEFYGIGGIDLSICMAMASDALDGDPVQRSGRFRIECA